MTEHERIPRKMRQRPIDDRWHLPIPAFAESASGADFQSVVPVRLSRLIDRGRCAMCGGAIERGVWWAIGEPEAASHGDVPTEALGHRDCVTYALAACPWLREATFQRRSGGRSDVGHVADPSKPPVWIVVEGRCPQLYEGLTLAHLSAVQVREWYGYVNRHLSRLTRSQAEQLVERDSSHEMRHDAPTADT